MAIFLGLHHTYVGRSGDEDTKLRQDALHGGQFAKLPKIFRDGIKGLYD